MFKTFIFKFMFYPQENATHYTNYILGISRNIPSNPGDVQFGNTNNRAATYYPMS